MFIFLSVLEGAGQAWAVYHWSELSWKICISPEIIISDKSSGEQPPLENYINNRSCLEASHIFLGSVFPQFPDKSSRFIWWLVLLVWSVEPCFDIRDESHNQHVTKVKPTCLARLSLLACLGWDNNVEGERFNNHKQTHKVTLRRAMNKLTTGGNYYGEDSYIKFKNIKQQTNSN